MSFSWFILVGFVQRLFYKYRDIHVHVAHWFPFLCWERLIGATLQVGRLENAIGWYHSHPGYGCWLSGIDVSTQMLNQQFQEPFVAVVVRLF